MIAEIVFGRKKLSGVTDEDRFFDGPFGLGSSLAGVRITPDLAMNFSAVYRAVAIIAGTVATLPLHLYTRLSDNERERIQNHPVYDLLNISPNSNMDSCDWRESMTASILLWGNAYARITWAGTIPVALDWLNPGRVKPSMGSSGELIYEVTDDGGIKRIYTKDEIFHIKNLSPDGLVGWSVIRKAREAIGLGLATEAFGATFFGNNSIPGGVLEHPGELDEEQARRLRTQWDEIHRGPGNAHRIAVLEEGMKYSQIGIPPEDAQFLETRKFQVTEIARWFGLPPHFLSDMEQATFSNIEQQSLEFVTYSLRYWLVKWEKGIHNQLLTEQEKKSIIVEHLVEALLRGDVATRFNAYALGRRHGFMSINDIRKRENLPLLGPEGDIYLVPVNMTDVRKLLEPDAPAPLPIQQQPGPVTDPDQQEEPDDNDPGENQEDNELSAAVREVFYQNWLRLLHKEQKAAIQAAKKPKEFLTWLDGYYDKTENLLAEALGPAFRAFACGTGNGLQLNELAKSWALASRERLLEVSGQCTAEDLLPGIEAEVSTWENRIATWFDREGDYNAKN